MTLDPDQTFEGERPRLVGLAYRLCGTLADAEDVVQETWIRWHAADHAAIETPAAWLTTVCSRVGLDRLRARQRERTDYVGSWLPEPLVATDADGCDPAEAVELSDSLTTSFLVLLERLRPEERLAVLLADVFAEPFASIAATLGQNEAACRQMTVRARRKIRSLPDVERDPLPAARDVARRLADALLLGDVTQVEAMLRADVVLVSDGGATVRAARRPVITPARVARLLMNLARKMLAAPEPPEIEETTVNGSPGIVVREASGRTLVQSIDVVAGRITRVYVTLNPEKLGALDHPVDLR